MLDKEKYINTMNLDREDENKHGWKLGDIVHISGSYVTANKYEYCGYPEFQIPAGSRARLTGIKQTDLNSTRFGNGDVYVDFELLDYTNSDGTQITCGNRHGWTFAEASPDFSFCPDGSGDPGYIRDGNRRNSGLWESIEGVMEETDLGYKWLPKKIVDPGQYSNDSDYVR